VLRPEFVRRKLQLIIDNLGRLAGFRDTSYDELIGDDISLAAVERLLERIVLRAIDVNEHILSTTATGREERTTRLSYRDTFHRLADVGVYPQDFAARITTSAGLRNIIVHEYNDVDHRIVHTSIRTCLEQYHDYVRAIGDYLDRREPAGS
jgi:uncharacterized protein YutE (UPF0331/DUF86 family)